MNTNPSRNRIFVSYSHADSHYLQRLKIHLSPYERLGLIDVWADTKISVGQDWARDIEDAMSQANIAILLISADFLASEFISTKELPRLLERAETDGVKIIPVILKPIASESYPDLFRFQAINDLRKPMVKMAEGESEDLWVQVVRAVNEMLPIVDSEKELDNKAPQASRISNNHPSKNAESELSEILGIRDFYNTPTFDAGYLDNILSREILNPDSISDYYIYQYEYLDYLEFIQPAYSFMKHIENRDEILSVVQNVLLNAGWEGDGELGLIWFPPFLGAGIEDTWGFCVWHVKQGNNGTSWLASPVELSFERLQYQNTWRR